MSLPTNDDWLDDEPLHQLEDEGDALVQGGQGRTGRDMNVACAGCLVVLIVLASMVTFILAGCHVL